MNAAQLTAVVERQEATIQALLQRIEALEAAPKAVSPVKTAASAIVKDKAGLVVKVPMSTPVLKARKDSAGAFWLDIQDQDSVQCTEYTARWWHKRLNAAQAA